VSGAAEPFERGLRFQLVLFEQAQAFAYDLAGVAVAAAANASLDKLVEMLGQVNVPLGREP